MVKSGVVLLGALLLTGCSLLTPKREPAVDFASLTTEPLSPEQTDELLNRTGENWLYGPGIGETTVNVATAIVFPPYAIYVLGNGILNLSGYEPLHVTDALPDEPRAMWNSAYDAVTSVPGRASAQMAGREYIDRESAQVRLREVVVPKGGAERLPQKESAVVVRSVKRVR